MNATIHDALRAAATEVVSVADGRWTFAIANGAMTPCQAHVEDDWLVLTAAPSWPARDALPSEWTMLAWNARFAGGVRFFAGAGAPLPALRAEIALGEADLDRRVGLTCDGFVMATSCLHGGGANASPDAVDLADDGALAALCRETRWTVKEHGAGALTVDLEVPGAFHQALVAPRAGGRVSVSVPVFETTMARPEPASAVCRQALGVFLVRMCGVLRMVRAAAESATGWAPRFEIVHAEPSAGALSHGFAALSIACRLAVHEAAVLWHDDAVARAYIGQ